MDYPGQGVQRGLDAECRKSWTLRRAA